jgi:hypothetical protein
MRIYRISADEQAEVLRKSRFVNQFQSLLRRRREDSSPVKEEVGVAWHESVKAASIQSEAFSNEVDI